VWQLQMGLGNGEEQVAFREQFCHFRFSTFHLDKNTLKKKLTCSSLFQIQMERILLRGVMFNKTRENTRK
jgi:hypothetical protein